MTPDRKKVIKGLEICYCPPSKCEDCPYHDLPVEQSCNDTLCLDALAMLKEQEPKTGKWILDDDDANSWKCSECGGLLIINDGTPHENNWRFCPYCGAKLDKQVIKRE